MSTWALSGNKANQTVADRNVALSNIVFASDLAEEGDYVASSNISALTGLNIFRQTVYSSNTIVRALQYHLSHTTPITEVGFHVYWDGENGNTGATFTAELRITFTPSDATGGGSGIVVGTDKLHAEHHRSFVHQYGISL